MSSHDEWNDDSVEKQDAWSEQPEQPADADQQPGFPPPKKKGIGTTAKVLIILLCGAAGLFLICCGGVVYFFANLKVESKEDAASTKATTTEIVDIKIPDEFHPAGSMKVSTSLFPMNVKVAVYSVVDGKGVLIIMAMKMPIAGADANMQQQIREELNKKGLGNQNLTIKEKELREFEIRGQKVSFLFAKAEQPRDQAKFRQVTGTFSGKNGTSFLMLQVEEEHYDEESVVKMIESIK